MISVALVDASINGTMITTIGGMFSYNILPNSYGFTRSSNGTLSLWSALDSEIDEKGLNDVNVLSGKLSVYGAELSVPYYTTENLTIFNGA